MAMLWTMISPTSITFLRQMKRSLLAQAVQPSNHHTSLAVVRALGDTKESGVVPRQEEEANWTKRGNGLLRRMVKEAHTQAPLPQGRLIRNLPQGRKSLHLPQVEGKFKTVFWLPRVLGWQKKNNFYKVIFSSILLRFTIFLFLFFLTLYFTILIFTAAIFLFVMYTLWWSQPNGSTFARQMM